MKIFKLSFLMILGISILSSCAKKTTPPAPAGPSMSATIAGTNWSASSVSAVNSSGYVLISGSGANSSYITIEMPATATAMTDSLPSTTGTYAVGYATGSTSYTMSKGALVITSNSGGTVSGTFSGTMTDGTTNVTVTKGAFTAKY